MSGAGRPTAQPPTGARGLPLVQFAERPGIIDLGWGHPDPALLPVEGLRDATRRALERHGADALNYGYAAGPGPFIEFVAQRLATLDARQPEPDSVVASAGNSHALDQVVTLLTDPGDVVLVEDPTYHLAVRILRDHPVELVGVPTDADGLNTEALAEALALATRTGKRARLLYTVPTFHNPTGVSLAIDRRRALIELAVQYGFTIVEDDAYRELAYDGPAAQSLWSLAPPGVVIRLVSFAKSLAPGLRVGAIVSDPATTRRFVESGVLDSGGGISHFSSLVVAEYGASGMYAPHVDRLRLAYRERRDALLAALDVLGPGASWTRPQGGYFVWLSLPGVDLRALLAAAEARGTSFMLGEAFTLHRGRADDSIRLAFSRYSALELGQAAGRLQQALMASDR